MKILFFGQIRKTCKIGALALSWGALPIFSQTYTIDGSTNLTTISTQVQGKTSGVIRIRFKTYQNVGQFSITSLSADSLIFERDSESAEAVEFTGKLFHFENVTTPVVFRNLAFKAKNGSSIFLEPSLSSPNQNLLLDSCQIFGDTLNGTFLSWVGGTGSKATITRTIIQALQGGNPKIDISADSIRVSNSLINYGGLLAATLGKRFDLTNVTSNRVQYKLTGDGTSVFSFKNNLFGHPPSQNKLPGLSNKFVTYIIGFAVGTAFDDARFSTWYGFDLPTGAVPHTDPTNVILPPFSDTTAVWDFRNPSDSLRGYAYPSSAKFPAFNVFPGDTLLPLRLSSKDSVALSITPAQIPRVIAGNYGTVTYPSITDSTRTLWLKDTTLQVTGSVSIKSITFPKAQSQGTPLLYYQSGSNFLPGAAGQEGSALFGNPSTSARNFIPTYSGQNTAKGSAIIVKGFSTDTSLVFSTITRAGRTSFQPPTLIATNKRWRVIQKGGKPLSFRDSTNAEGSGDLVFGFGKIGAETPFLTDSLFWWLGGNSFSSKSDSAGKYLGKTTFASVNQALLVERLAVGVGRDTIALTQGRVITTSTNGHQLKVDSTYQPDQIHFPDMGSFSKGLSFSWAGRGTGDSLFLIFTKSNPLQKAYSLVGLKPTALTPIREDSAFFTVALAISDSGKIVFLARKYTVPVGIKTDLHFGSSDSIVGLLSSKPGEISVDTVATLNGLDLTTSRLLGSRLIKSDSLEVQGTFNLSFLAKTPIRKDSVKVLVFDGTSWKLAGKVEISNRYTISIDKSVKAVAILEGLSNQDLIPKPPMAQATKSIVGNILNIVPKLTIDEKANIKSFNVDLFSIDLAGKAVHQSSGYIPIDSASSLTLKNNNIYAYRVIYKSVSDRLSLDTMWIPLGEKQFDANSVQDLAPSEKAKIWHLIGFPFKGTYKDNIETGLISKTSDDQVELNTLANSQWSALPTTNLNFERGTAFLFGGTLPFQIKIGASIMPSLMPDTVKIQEGGWHLISNPFPFPIADAKIKLEPLKVSLFQSLRRLDSASVNKVVYTWDLADTLYPFEGYLVYTFAKTEIIFDPFSQLPNPAPKKSINSSTVQALKLSLSNGKEASAMTFYLGNHFRQTPYFQPLNAGLELKVGENEGFLYKPVVKLDSIESEVIIHSNMTGVVSLSAIAIDEGHNVLSSNLIQDIRLIDNQSGLVYGNNDLNSIQVNKGDNSFKILVGTSSSIDQRVKSTLAGMPLTFSMEQNFPNPFFGETQIRYQIPLNIGKVQEVRLDVFDISGKKIQTVNLEDATIGQRRNWRRNWQRLCRW